jgi:hypothetical protein
MTTMTTTTYQQQRQRQQLTNNNNVVVVIIITVDRRQMICQIHLTPTTNSTYSNFAYTHRIKLLSTLESTTIDATTNTLDPTTVNHQPAPSRH